MDGSRYRDEVEGRKCRACREPLPTKWSPPLCRTCLKAYSGWIYEEDHRLFTFDRIDLLKDQPHRMDTRELKA